MMRRVLLLTSLAVLCGCTFKEEPPLKRRQSPAPVAERLSAPSDPIDALVAKLSKTQGMWLNGISPVIEMPEGAPIEDLVAEFFQKVNYDGGPIGSQRIAEIRRVTIPPGLSSDEFIAVLVNTNLGRKILLLQYSKSGGWWSRVYDV